VLRFHLVQIHQTVYIRFQLVFAALAGRASTLGVLVVRVIVVAITVRVIGLQFHQLIGGQTASQHVVVVQGRLGRCEVRAEDLVVVVNMMICLDKMTR
jgi:hypothetical protein